MSDKNLKIANSIVFTTSGFQSTASASVFDWLTRALEVMSAIQATSICKYESISKFLLDTSHCVPETSKTSIYSDVTLKRKKVL